MLCVGLDVSRDNSWDTPLQNDFLYPSFLQILIKEINLTSHLPQSRSSVSVSGHSCSSRHIWPHSPYSFDVLHTQCKPAFLSRVIPGRTSPKM